MQFDLDERPGVWFDFPGGGRVQLRTIGPAEYLKIRKATVKQEPFIAKVDGAARLFEREIVDDEKQRLLSNDATIVAWEGFFNLAEQPLPCTPEMKTRLMLASAKFRDFVNAKLKELGEAESGQAEAIEKN